MESVRIVGVARKSIAASFAASYRSVIK